MSQTFDFKNWITYIEDLQDRICKSLEEADTQATFKEDLWNRAGGGGGRTRVISNGLVFEKGGVNISHVHGEVTPLMEKSLNIKGHQWAAAGLSMVIHPKNPHVPTFHANWRYFELYDEAENVIDKWIGGGMDLTPYYLNEEMFIHFHTTIKASLDDFNKELYPLFKKQCDDYFNNHHRGIETRGIGGVFYDHIQPENEWNLNEQALFELQKSQSNSFFKAYIEIVNQTKETPFSDSQKYWQEIRRGRYVEFNLIHDRGTTFGLKTNGRVESILMSLPPTVRFDYDYQPKPNSPESEIIDIYRNPKEWIVD